MQHVIGKGARSFIARVTTFQAKCQLPIELQGNFSRKTTHRNSGLLEVQLECHGLPHEDVRVMARLKHPLQLLELPLGKVGPRPTSLSIVTLRVWKCTRRLDLEKGKCWLHFMTSLTVVAMCITVVGYKWEVDRILEYL